MQNYISTRKVPLTQKEIKKRIKFECPFNHMTVIMKKQALLDGGNYDKHIMLEDYDLWAKMTVMDCNMMNVKNVFCNVRTSESMYKRRSGINRIKKITQIEKRLLEYKIINRGEYIFNITIRSIFALIPAEFKKFFYSKIVRKI